MRTAPRIAARTWAFAQAKLAQLGSPEQICGFVKSNGQPGISHETVYLRIYAEKRAGGPPPVNIDSDGTVF